MGKYGCRFHLALKYPQGIDPFGTAARPFPAFQQQLSHLQNQGLCFPKTRFCQNDALEQIAQLINQTINLIVGVGGKNSDPQCAPLWDTGVVLGIGDGNIPLK